MGNCLSKISEGSMEKYERHMSNMKGSIECLRQRFRYEDWIAEFNGFPSIEIITPVEDRFPPQACNLEWAYKVNKLDYRLYGWRA